MGLVHGMGRSNFLAMAQDGVNDDVPKGSNALTST